LVLDQVIALDLDLNPREIKKLLGKISSLALPELVEFENPQGLKAFLSANPSQRIDISHEDLFFLNEQIILAQEIITELEKKTLEQAE